MDPMEVREGLYYTEDHEWARPEGDRAYIGITAYAAHHLRDIVYVELPEDGSEHGAGDVIGVIESVKAVSDMHTPISGVVLESNRELETTPQALNSDPYGQHITVLRMSDPGELARLMNSEQYAAFCTEDTEDTGDTGETEDTGDAGDTGN